MVMGGALKCILDERVLCDHVLGEFTLYGVITKQSFLICPKFEGKVASQSWKHCSVTKILRKIRATTFTENYGKLSVRGMSERHFQLVLVAQPVTCSLPA